ncbi:Metallothionein expression activator [Madurella fahalii]|uniref:Metallothionein expression activator n=1 Tax=Madurella fahalii TaxID=1157608 RepID=A0ABQ0GJA9_9PEZI
MLSNPPPASGLHSRQRHHQHRRQNSTPSAFEAVRIAPLPSFQPQQRSHMSHRRGLSLDTRRQQLTPTSATTTTRQDYTTHILREAQQQRTARPGPGQPTYNDDSDAYLLSPHVTPQHQRFANPLSGRAQMADMAGLSFESYIGAIDIIKNQTNFVNGLDGSRDFEFFGSDSALSTPTFMTFPDSSPASTGQGWISESETASTQSRRASRRISGGIMEKVARFEALGNGDVSTQRPCTPANQIVNGCFPQTPVDNPHQQPIRDETTPLQPANRFSEDYDESMEETIKPIRGNKPGNRNSGIFQELRQQAEAMIQTPPRANTMPVGLMNQGLSTPEFMNMRNISAEFVKIERAFDGASAGPMAHMLARPHSAFDNKPNLHPPADSDSQNTVLPTGAASPGSKTPSRRSSPHRRTDSIASITSAASIADINIEETKTETGVTLDDIAAFIQGPDPSDGKWECLYENCHKRFGRKENIKSHVQTHLNDRQYQCPTCKKCFVRQHDLKRHAKIHTGIKPYPCECGNSFARHDALTRHRQRGMCIGAFDGIVRKVVKRGRPKKIRPDMEERREKSERTRRKNRLNSVSSVSSQSGCSDSSAANSPRNGFDGLMDEDQFPDILDVALSSIPTSAATMNPTSLGVSSAPMPTTISGTLAGVFGAALSPANHVSPSAMSNYSHASHISRPATASSTSQHTTAAAAAAADLHNPASPAKSVASHYTHLPGTPPELSSSSSPPPTGTSAKFFDLGGDPNSSGISDTSIGLGTTVAAHAAVGSIDCSSGGSGAASCMGPGGGGLVAAAMHDNDMLLQFADHEGLVPLDHHHHHHHHHPGMLLGKYDEDFDAAVSMFTNGEDVFFGTS